MFFLMGLPCPPPGDIPHPGIEPRSLMSPALAGGFFTTEPPGKPISITDLVYCTPEVTEHFKSILLQ